MNVPEIRFKGFYKQWESNTIGEISNSYSGGTPSVGCNEFYGGNIPFIRSGEIYNDTTELYLTPKGLYSSSAKIVDKGTILYALYGATSGEVNICKIRGAINQAILAIIPKKNINNYYLLSLLRNKKIEIIGSLLQGGQGNLSGTLIKKYLIFFPELPEQQKIASYFQSLDSLIQTTSKELASLKQIKAASQQSMFPQEGETVPKVRFKGFEGEWEPVKLSKIGYMTAGGTPSTFVDKYWNGEINWLQSGIVQNRIIYTSSVERKITAEGLSNSAAHMIKKDSVLIAITGATCANIGYLTFESAANQSVVSIEPNNNFYSKFIYSSLISERSQILSFKGGSAQSGVTLANLKEILLKCPSFGEQVFIGDYFFSLEKNIELLTQRLEKLKQIKAACMDKMFV